MLKEGDKQGSGVNAPRRGFPKQRRGYSDIARDWDEIEAEGVFR